MNSNYGLFFLFWHPFTVTRTKLSLSFSVNQLICLLFVVLFSGTHFAFALCVFLKFILIFLSFPFQQTCRYFGSRISAYKFNTLDCFVVVVFSSSFISNLFNKSFLHELALVTMITQPMYFTPHPNSLLHSSTGTLMHRREIVDNKRDTAYINIAFNSLLIANFGNKSSTV